MESEDEELEEQMREAERATLRSAGLLAEEEKNRKGKGRAVPRKIVFKDTREQGSSPPPSCIYHFTPCA
jgi:hypothetical protein